jgi:hypothetical protein
MSSAIVGYIIQILDEEQLLPPMGMKHLFVTFKDAIEHGQALYQSYMESRCEEYEGPFEVYKPTKGDVDIAGGALIFRSRDIHIWIDGISR